MRLPRLRSLRPIAVTVALLSCTENGPVGPNLDSSGARLITGGATSTVVISQVYSGAASSGALYKNKYIELFNRGTSAVTMTNWSVQYASATGTGTFGSNGVGTVNTTLAPGQYYLIQVGAGGTSGSALPSPDLNFSGVAGFSSFNPAAAAGKVVLVNNNTPFACNGGSTPCTAAQIAQVVDLVGYGTATSTGANWFEGSSAAPTLSATNAGLRKVAGCTDTDNNGADFTAGAPLPRNTASPFAPCGVVVNPVDHLTITPTSSTIAYKGTQAYSAKVFNSSNVDITATNPVSWTSSATSIATVASTSANPATATATSVTAGDVTITAAAGGKTASAALHINVPPPPPTIHFSELHYDNSGSDVGEAIEIEGPPGTDLTGWSVVLYGGDAVPDFSAYSTTDLGVTLPTTCTGKGVVVINYSPNGIKNAKFGGVGNPAGMALVDNNNQVVEFLSYEGTFTALDGPAAGKTSIDMGVSEDPAPAAGNSLKRDALGIWQAPSAADFGACNGSGVIIPPTTNTITFTGRLATDPALPVGFEDQLFASEKNSSNISVTTTFQWTALTPTIATIDTAGVMHAQSAGTATFQAKAEDGTTATYSLQMVNNVFSATADWSGNLEFGTPADNTPADDHIITHTQFTTSYSLARKIPNWVSAKLDVSHYGANSDRCDCFTWDPLVGDSANQYYTTNAWTGVGSTWNRGHLLRSADVEASAGDNSIAYYFSNIAPQSADMNQGPWAVEENFLGDLAKTGGKDVYEIMGVSGSQGTLKGVVGAPTIPAKFWKVAVIVPHGRKLADIHDYGDLQIISVIMPNVNGIKNVDWTTYKTTVDAVEALSGYDLLNALPDDIEPVVESNDQIPTAVMTGPNAGAEGSELSFSGNGSTDPDVGDVLTYSWNFGDNTTGTGLNVSHTFTDNGQYIVTLTVRDQIGAKNVTTKVVTVSNVAPSGLFASPAPVTEGSTFTLAISNVTDPSSADVAAGFSYRFDCGTGFGGWTSSASASCFASDNPGSSVAAEVRDKDGDVSHYAGAIVVSNVTPTAVFSNNGPLDEGTGFTLRLDGALDPSPADVAAGFQYRFDCGAGPGPWQFAPSAFCPAADNGTFNVSGEVKDKDGASSFYSAAVVVNNVAPTAVFSNNGPVDEGHPYTLTLANASDVSSTDVAAGLQYRFDCGTGFGSWGGSPSASCPAPDHGTFSVAGEIRDKDLGVSSYAGSVTVNNVAPTAVFLYSGSVNEGSPITLEMNNGTDSPADVAAGLQYRFDCGTGFGSWGSATTVSCPTNDDGTPSVSGEVRDRDGAASVYSGTVVVKNVAPTGSYSGAVSADEGGTYALSVTGANDPSSVDAAAGFTYRFDCGTGFGSWSSASSASCAASDNPGNATRAEIQDKNGGVTSFDGTVTIANVAPTATFSNSGPVNEGSNFTLTLSDGADASAVDVAAGLQYRFDCGTGFADWSSSNSIACSAPNHGTYAVGGEVRDKDGGSTSYTGSVVVVNTAPTALFTYEATALEGGTYKLTASNGSDSPADLAAGLEYRFDCGSGFGAWSSATTRTCAAADNGNFSVIAEVRDQGHSFSAYSGSVAVGNVAPSGTFSNATAVEGGTYTLSVSNPSDASQADVAAGFSYRFDCGAGYGAWSANNSASCTAGDNPGNATRAEIQDKDGGITSFDGTVVVSNVAPTATFANNGPVDEGGNFTLTFSNASDASAADVAAGFQYRFDCGSGFADWSSAATIVCTAPNHGSYAVGGEVKDKDGGVRPYAGSVVVNNAAPTALFTYEATALEGGTYKLTTSNGSDSPADLTAGLEYRFDCGSGFGSWSSAATRTCAAADNGVFNVIAEVRDQSHSVTAYGGTVTVTNVAPTGTFSTSAPVSEGTTFTLSLSGAADASPVDQSAGFTYRFDCGSGYAGWTSSSSAVCLAGDNPGYQTRGEVRDKDGGISSYSVFSAVTNASPSVVVGAGGSITSGGTFNLSASFADAGQNDGPWSYVINWGDGNSTGSTNVQGAIAGSHQYFTAGSYTVTLTVKDKDGAVGSKSTTIQVSPVSGTMDVLPNQINTSNNGSGIVKATVFGSSSFSASNIVLSTVRVGSVHPAKEGNGAYKIQITDVNRDGIPDMVAQFTRSDLAADGDLNGSMLTLNATLTDGRQVQTTGPISVK